jgi:hypothetical protein
MHENRNIQKYSNIQNISGMGEGGIKENDGRGELKNDIS